MVFLLWAAAATGCGDNGGMVGHTDDAAPMRPDAAYAEVETRPTLSRDVDILFVVDDSGSMRQEQESLANNAQRFVDVLQQLEGGLPNIHLGFVSSNVGTGPSGGGGDACLGNGDNGHLLVRDGCPLLTDGTRFISDIEIDEPAGTREFNYSGDLATQFACMAQLGVQGCGFEQHLESMKRALDPDNANNAGFVRDDAYLAVIFLQDEDDCSAVDRAMFDPTQDSRDAPLGELSSFRCFEFGTTCVPADERSYGSREDCVPGDDDTEYMTDVRPYVRFLTSLKGDPSKVIAAGIMGDRADDSGRVVISEDESKDPPELWTEPVCVVCPGGGSSGCSLSPTDPDGALVAAAPSIRMRAFLDAFPHRSTWQNICSYDAEQDEVDLSGGVTRIASLVLASMSGFCLIGEVSSSVDCHVAEVVDDVEQDIPPCDQSGPPCFNAWENRTKCPDTESGVVVEIDPGDAPPADNTSVVVRCVVE
jgi:hypothetical protein